MFFQLSGYFAIRSLLHAIVVSTCHFWNPRKLLNSDLFFLIVGFRICLSSRYSMFVFVWSWLVDTSIGLCIRSVQSSNTIFADSVAGVKTWDVGFLVTRVSQSYSYSSFLNRLIVHWVYALLSTLICILCFWVFEQCLALVGNPAGTCIFLWSQLWPYKNALFLTPPGPGRGYCIYE